jgi:hypothetical protein
MQVDPACIVRPNAATDVSSAIKLLANPARRTCKFAIRSGGHMPFAGSANIEGGITFDLSTLNQIQSFSNNDLVLVGPGQKWGAVYWTLGKMGRSVIGGRASSVGVGGSTLGGQSESFFTPQLLSSN